MIPNEKMTEMLFSRYFLQSFGLGQIILYAPSSREEYEKGYDAKLTSSRSFNEVFLQFKRPRVTADKFLLRTTPHQHKNLQKRPPDSCYYVGHTFRDLQEFEQAQKDRSASKNFLKYFILVEISCLDPNLTTIIYERNDDSLIPRTVSQKYNTESTESAKGGKRDRTTRIIKKKYFTGRTFREAFSHQEIGVQVSLATEGDLLEYSQADQIDSAKAVSISPVGLSEDSRQIWHPDPSLMKDISAVGSQAEGKRGNFGSLYRLPRK